MFKSGGAREQGQTPPETALQEQLKQGRSLLLSSPRLATSDDSKIRASLWCLLVLIPSERSTGATVRRGGITKAGNSRVAICWKAPGLIGIHPGSVRRSFAD